MVLFGFWKNLLILILYEVLTCCFLISSLEAWILDWILDAWSWSLESITWAFGIIKIAWFIIMKLASTISPFFMMTNLKSRNTYKLYLLIDHSLNSPPLFFEFKLHLKLSYLIIWVLDSVPIFSPPLASTKSQSAYRDIKSYTNS